MLWNETRSAFLMYGAQGRSWVALGDPVGPPEAAPDLIRAFLERVDDYDGVPVFYQVRGRPPPLVRRLRAHRGEAGRGGARSARDLLDRRRRASRSASDPRTLEREGGDVPRGAGRGGGVDPARAARGVGRLAEHEAASEKGFSLGFFDGDYLRRFPVALIEAAGGFRPSPTCGPGPGARSSRSI